jgi:hypothetical protein
MTLEVELSAKFHGIPTMGMHEKNMARVTIICMKLE